MRTLRLDLDGAAEGGTELEETEEAALRGHRGRVIVQAVGTAAAAKKKEKTKTLKIPRNGFQILKKN